MRRIIISILCLTFIFSTIFNIFGVDAKEPPTTLQIGIKHRVPEGQCTKMTKDGDSISVHYTGVLFEDGKEFDSSIPRGEPFTFTLGVGQVIKGWDQGLKGMCIGEKRKLIIPSHLAYGTRGSPPAIPENAALVFDVELVGIGKNRVEL
ncbi:10142_t:CDS:2 [Scutellospora calospora]|uniref:10142_t:CDS:1 n=1 Tax=Scutellospora calospora TaxID=85575 RepID=A0ACA9MLW5_9GLOM|nr:10142_t:CDS:2 [Scutellospora calospora]